MPKPKTAKPGSTASKKKATQKLGVSKTAGKNTKKTKVAAKCPTFTVSRSEFPGHVKVLENAKKKGHKLTGLQRQTGKNNIRRNRRRSQAPIRKAKGPPKKGHDYDEYPYASTHQGGTGAYVEPNKSEDNQGAGRALGSFYRKNNIGEGDTFNIKIVP
jgi:hypothetical protein